MTCHAVRERMLEVDLAELRGESDSPLAQHLASCDECRRLAQKVVDAEAALGESLQVMAGIPRRRSSQRTTRKRTRWMSAVGLAAAASLVALLVRGGSEPLETFTTPRVTTAVPLVENTGGQNVAVFTTDDPDIVVVWFLGGTD